MPMKVEFEERLVEDAVITKGCCENTSLVEFSLIHEILYGYAPARFFPFKTVVKCSKSINSRDADEWLAKLKKGFKVRVSGEIHFNSVFDGMSDYMNTELKKRIDSEQNPHVGYCRSWRFPDPVVKIWHLEVEVLDTTPTVYQEPMWVGPPRQLTDEEIRDLYKPHKEDEKEKSNEA